MPDPRTTQARLDSLETRLSHQERVIDDLSAVVTAQWAAIDALKRRLERLDDRLEAAETREGAVVPQQRPPHY